MAARKPGNPPPGRVKIVKALQMLLETRDFSSITTQQIAATAGVTEALIYKYFKNKRDLLYQVLEGQFQQFIKQSEADLSGAGTQTERLRAIILSMLRNYDRYRVFARILLLEVRNTPSFYESRAYGLVKHHSNLVLQIIEAGVASGEIRGDIDPLSIRRTILGAIEHNFLSALIFNRPLAPIAIADDICRIVFTGILNSQS